jgi:galactosamine-6-phosphate isomerase
MKLFISDDYAKMSKEAADAVIKIMQSGRRPVICAASGHSPEGLYREIIERVRKKEFNVDNWLFLGLDEWVGMNGIDPGSCRHHLDLELLKPLQIPDDRICFFDGRADDLDAECERIEKFIREQGGIDVAVLGLGMNGHIGMNEPGVSLDLRSHVIDLHPITKTVGQKYFKEQKELAKGITLGMATLMEADNLIVVISGTHKAEIAHEMIEGEVSENVPATLLRTHPALKVYLDSAAASKIIAL